jgi:hypothetical protein
MGTIVEMSKPKTEKKEKEVNQAESIKARRLERPLKSDAMTRWGDTIYINFIDKNGTRYELMDIPCSYKSTLVAIALDLLFKSEDELAKKVVQEFIDHVNGERPLDDCEECRQGLQAAE